MYDDDKKSEKIKMYYRDEFGNTTKLSHTFGSSNLIEWSSLEEIASFVNNFLFAVGFASFDKEMVFLESVTYSEYEFLADALDDRREAMKTCVKCDDYLNNGGHCYGGVLYCTDFHNADETGVVPQNTEDTEILG